MYSQPIEIWIEYTEDVQLAKHHWASHPPAHHSRIGAIEHHTRLNQISLVSMLSLLIVYCVNKFCCD
jgi:hypothetical protein